MTDFSVVLPMRDTELRLLKRNLPSWCLLKPSEILLGLDQPASQKCVSLAKEIASRYDVNLRIIEIERNPEYKMYQAWARRKCFREAEHDIILTGDIDLYVYPACIKAVELVGKGNVGLVSLSKLRNQRSFSGILRNFIHNRVRESRRRKGLLKENRSYFTGLYCIYRPYWLDSEDEVSIKNMLHPYDAPLLVDSWGGYRGEDTHLRDHMIKKYQCVYLADIGAEDLRPGLEERKQIQSKIGMMFAHEGRSPVSVLNHALFNLRFHVYKSYMKQLRKTYGDSIIFKITKILAIYGNFLILDSLLRYLPPRLFFRYIIGKKAARLANWMPNEQSIVNKYMEYLWLKTLLRTYKHELHVSITLKRIRGSLFVDVGANRGYYSLLLRNNFERVIAFEPAAAIYQDLAENIKLFVGRETRISAEKVAVSNIDSECELYLVKNQQSNKFVTDEQLIAHPSIINHSEGNVLQREKVTKISLSTYLKEEQVIDLIKVDVGGSEWEVLDGAVPIIDRIKTWLVELYSPTRYEEMQEWFARYGYKTRLLSYSAMTCHVLATR
jgi:FkbM family methyltransferase